MSNIDELSKQFLLMCVEQTKQVYPNPSDKDFLQGVIIQLVGKLYELESRIKELEND